MTTIHEVLAEQAEILIESGKWVRIHFGHLSIVAVAYEKQPSHDHLAWLSTDHDGSGMLIDINSIFAVEEVDPVAPE